MELEQTWFPHGGGPNWLLRIFIAVSLLGIAAVFYYSFFYRKTPEAEEKRE